MGYPLKHVSSLMRGLPAAAILASPGHLRDIGRGNPAARRPDQGREA